MVSVAEQADFGITWLETPKADFLASHFDQLQDYCKFAYSWIALRHIWHVKIRDYGL